METRTIWISAYWNQYDKKFSYHVQSYPPGDDSEFILVEERDITFETAPDLQMRQAAAEEMLALEDKS